jgi:cytochrome P450
MFNPSYVTNFASRTRRPSLEGRVPTAHEIANTTVYYLNACIKELIRCSQTAPIPSHTASTNAVVLGHVIPEGTLVIMTGQSIGNLEPSHNIPDSFRLLPFRNAGGGKIGAWDESSPEEIMAFNPDHWLKTDVDRSRVFDATHGAHLGLGACPRGCSGRKLAYLELRMAIVLVLWHFELQKVLEHLDSYEPIE